MSIIKTFLPIDQPQNKIILIDFHINLFLEVLKINGALKAFSDSSKIWQTLMEPNPYLGDYFGSRGLL